MIYPTLAFIFILSLLIVFSIFFLAIFRPHWWLKRRQKIAVFCALWFAPYFFFILFFTGPLDLSRYPPAETSPYRLPWQAGVARFVAQGNRSFTSHRGFHLYAWDFVMPTGTPVLAARGGRIAEVEDDLDGYGFKANIVTIEHEDGDRSVYAHIQHRSALVKAGDMVRQGQPIALSGRVGQAPFHISISTSSTRKERPPSRSLSEMSLMEFLLPAAFTPRKIWVPILTTAILPASAILQRPEKKNQERMAIKPRAFDPAPRT